MTVVMEESLKNILEQVKTRKSWPVTLLAKVLGRPRRYVYRKADKGDFHIVNDGGFMKIDSESVVRYYSEEHHKKL